MCKIIVKHKYDHLQNETMNQITKGYTPLSVILIISLY